MTQKFNFGLVVECGSIRVQIISISFYFFLLIPYNSSCLVSFIFLHLHLLLCFPSRLIFPVSSSFFNLLSQFFLFLYLFSLCLLSVFFNILSQFFLLLYLLPFAFFQSSLLFLSFQFPQFPSVYLFFFFLFTTLIPSVFLLLAS